MKIQKLSILLLLSAYSFISFSQDIKWASKSFNTENGLMSSGVYNEQFYFYSLNKAGQSNYHLVNPDLSVNENALDEAKLNFKNGITSEYDKKAKTLTIFEKGKQVLFIESIGHPYTNFTSAPEILTNGSLRLNADNMGIRQKWGLRLGKFPGANFAGKLAVNYDHVFTGDYSQVGIYYSPDKKRRLVVYRKLSESKSNSKNVDVYCIKEIDSQFKVVREADISLPYLESQVMMNTFGITNAGRVFFVGKIKEGKEDPGRLNVGLIDLDSKSFSKMLPIKSNALFYLTIAVSIINDDEIKINSLYTNNDKYASNINGSISATVNLESGNVQVKETKFEGNFPFTWEENNKLYKAGMESKYYEICAINLESDGISYASVANYKVSYNETTYSMNEGIALLKTDYDGNVIFKSKINRKLEEANHTKLGVVFMHAYKGNYYFLYCVNTSEINLISEDTEPKNFKTRDGGFSLVCTKISSSGEMETEDLTGSLNVDQFPIIEDFMGYENQILLVDGRRSEVFPSKYVIAVPINIKLGLLTL